MNHQLLKIVKGGLYLVLFLPLLITPGTLFPWNFGKTIIFHVIVEILLVCYVLIISGEDGRRLLPFQRPRLLESLAYLFLLILLITAFTGVDSVSSFWGNQARANGVFTWLHFGVYYFLLLQVFREKPDWIWLMRLSVVAAALSALSAVFQDSLPAAWRSDTGPRLSGIIGNPAFLAAYLVPAFGLSLLLTAWSWDDVRSKRQGWVCMAVSVGASVLLVAALLSTSIRGAFVGVVIASAVGCVLAVAYSKHRKRALLIGGIIVLLFASLMWLSSTGKIQGLDVWNVRNYLSGTANTRLMAWRIAWQGFREKPVLGWGMENYDVIFNKHYNPLFLQYSFSETVWDKPHNWFLEVADGSGIAGFLSYVGILAGAGYVLFKRVSSQSQGTILTTIILFYTLVAYSVQNAFLFETTNALMLFFLLIGYISFAYGNPSSSTGKPEKINRLLLPTIVQKTVNAIMVLLVLFSLYRYNYLPLQASAFARRGQLTVSMDEWAANAEKSLAIPVPFRGESAVFLAERFVNLEKANVPVSTSSTVAGALRVAKVLDEEALAHPDKLAYPMWAGQMYMALGEHIDERYYVEAERAFKEAGRISPRRHEPLFYLARVYLLEKEFDQAAMTAREAVALDPTIRQSHWFLGLTYAGGGETARGLEEIEKALNIGYTLSTEEKLYVIDLYAAEKNYDKVIAWYKDFISKEPDNVNWYIKLAASYAAAGEKEQALATVKQAVAMYPPLRPDAEKFVKENKLGTL